MALSDTGVYNRKTIFDLYVAVRKACESQSYYCSLIINLHVYASSIGANFDDLE